MLLLVALTVQIAVGGPGLAAAVVRHEVATERDGIRRLSSTVARAFQSLVALAPIAESRVVTPRVFGVTTHHGAILSRDATHRELRPLARLIDLPPPAMA
ncbi:MAG: hypothetical protein ACI89L_001617 [Phycisphaerales bacterium]|jgi:hypothetical protein